MSAAIARPRSDRGDEPALSRLVEEEAEGDEVTAFDRVVDVLDHIGRRLRGGTIFVMPLLRSEFTFRRTTQSYKRG